MFAVRHAPLCVYAFDMMEIQGRDIRNDPLVQRRAPAQIAAEPWREQADLATQSH